MAFKPPVPGRDPLSLKSGSAAVLFEWPQNIKKIWTSIFSSYVQWECPYKLDGWKLQSSSSVFILVYFMRTVPVRCTLYLNSYCRTHSNVAKWILDGCGPPTRLDCLRRHTAFPYLIWPNQMICIKNYKCATKILLYIVMTWNRKSSHIPHCKQKVYLCTWNYWYHFQFYWFRMPTAFPLSTCM